MLEAGGGADGGGELSDLPAEGGEDGLVAADVLLAPALVVGEPGLRHVGGRILSGSFWRRWGGLGRDEWRDAWSEGLRPRSWAVVWGVRRRLVVGGMARSFAALGGKWRETGP